MSRHDEPHAPATLTPAVAAQLRAEAEAHIRAKQHAAPADITALSPEAIQAVLHDLRVYQVELEMQNEELRRTQIVLDDERARYFDLYELAPVGYCTLDGSGAIEQVNLTAASLFGAERDALVGQPISRFIAGVDQDIFYLCRQRLVASSAAQNLALRMLRIDGSWFWASLAIARATTPTSDAATPQLRMTLTDITENKRAEGDLRESEERYRSLFNSMEEGYCIIKVLFDGNNKAVDYRFLEVNPAFERQSGMHGVVGKRVRERYPDLEQHWFDAYGKVALTGTPVRFADRAKAIGNRWFEINAFRIGAPGGHKVAIIFNNITERRRVDAERERLDQILQDKNAELELAIRVADKANLAKSEFLSSMSHELRTPLSAILGFAQLIESGTPAPTPSQARSLEQILRSGWYLLELINEILDLALIESGKMALSLEPIALDDILLECGAMVETQAAKREICVTLPTLDRTQIVVADGKRLKQVLINLLANAIKYNRSGGEVSVRCDAPSEGRVRISVSDTGAGIDANQLTQLFQPFNRLGRESTAEEGTGIGLVVCKRLIELMGGSIGVDSRVGEGSVFWIELALSAQRAHAPAKHGTLAVALPRTDQSLRTLLHIEDNPVNQLLVEELVARRDDLRLLTASDGRSGYELAVAAQPDVILLDINLPGISGVETLKLLAAHPRTAGIPVVAISANAMPHDIQRGLAAGFFRYLTKPIVIAEFMHTMDLALQFATLHPVRALTEEPQ